LHKREAAIVIPVYVGLDDTMRCIASVRATCPSTEIIVVDDASPDQVLVRRLESLSDEKAITLIHNSANLGFPGAVNRGIALVANRDVVILNSDAEVYGDWLPRLRAAAYSAAMIGTVTPFASEASIATYAPVPADEIDARAAQQIDALAAEVNRGNRVEIPTGVGFCLYMRRDCIDAVGELDATVYGAGYGEENDFCLRARKLGWRHLLAADVFVRHRGGASFGIRRAALTDRNSRLLSLRYPAYDREIQRFWARDPLRFDRRRLDEARFKSVERRYVVILTLALPGGVARFVEERCDQLRDQGLTPIVVKPFGRGEILLDANGVTDALRYRVPAEIGAVRRLFSAIAVEHVELQHFLGHHEQTIETILSIASVYDVYIHDYAWICPRISLLARRLYCGEPPVTACAACVKRNGSVLPKSLSAAALRRRSGRWLAGARQVFVPTTEVRNRIDRHFPDVDVTVRPWQPPGVSAEPLRSSPRSSDPHIRVGLIGAINQNKGFGALLAAARDAAKRKLPLEFIVIGFTENDDALRATGKVFITGEYEDDELPALIRRERPHVWFFPTPAPETWCYALTAAIGTGWPILGFNIGAIAARLQGLHRGRLIAHDSSARTCNQQLLDLACGDQSERLQNTGVTGRDEAQTNEPDPLRGSERRHIMATEVLTREANGEELTSSVRVLTLADGLYAFTVRAAAVAKLSLSDRLSLPALYVSRAPGRDPGQVEFLSGPFVRDRWLSEPGDVVAARINGGPVNILLTSLRAPGAAELTVEVQRLDHRDDAVLPAARPARLATAESSPADRPPADAIPTEIILHVQNHGDVTYANPAWAGARGQGLWIEGFKITPTSALPPEDIEYKALTANGVETPWIRGGELCGTRGMGMPLVGFAVRTRSAATARFNCEYNGAFLSGATAGPFRNGAPCRGSAPTDALEAIQVYLLPRGEATVNASARPDRNGAAPAGSGLHKPSRRGKAIPKGRPKKT
jgi:GT2 family glycosyltransferase